ncbi:MAG TPA: CcmD family protein [bacterium]|nr:CcmD family protein [bacterium]HQG46618.1 CcmD family protein [bacterium]HQI47451.1 CcmD family protein [bacterium]HQJ64658.1 CcmD family protein [bacterium]
MQNLNFLFAAYSLIWLALFLFLLRLAKKVSRLEQELRRFEDK